MKHSTTNMVAWAACALLAATASACGNGDSGSLSGDRGNGSDPNGTDDGTSGSGGAAGTPGAPGAPAIVRKTDFGEALRSASLKLVGDLPTLAEIKSIAAATSDADKKTAYEAAVDKYLADPRFSDTQFAWWQNTLKTGTDTTIAATAGAPNFDTAAAFAAQVVTTDRPFTDILTASTGTCPKYAAGGTFTTASCTTTGPVSGVLTDPGLMAQYFSNMSFRRVRFIQETFACQKFPAEVKAVGTPMGSGSYTSPWDFNSIAGGAGANIDFHDTSAVICANCHTTMNHIAPMFATFDAKGAFQTTIQVMTPVTPPVTTTMKDWLPDGQALAWRNGVTVTDIPSLGAAMAKDPDVLQCGVTRVWNWALSRGDVVNDGATVTPSVTADQVAAFKSGGFKLKSVIRSVFTSDDFVQF